VDTYGADGGPAEELTALLAGHPASIARLLDEHVDDGSGRCGICHAGMLAGQMQWPCRLRLLAEAAQQHLDGLPRRGHS
jgi:hypothetical protein